MAAKTRANEKGIPNAGGQGIPNWAGIALALAAIALAFLFFSSTGKNAAQSPETPGAAQAPVATPTLAATPASAFSPTPVPSAAPAQLPQPPSPSGKHFNRLGTLAAVEAPDSLAKFYVSFFADIREPLSNASISVGGKNFSYDGAPSCLEYGGNITGACTLTYADRWEIEYLAAVENSVPGKSYEIKLQSDEKNASMTYVKK